jgi:hypothetical protein
VSVNSAGKQGNGEANHPAIGASGRFVAFTSQASNLAKGDTNKCRPPNAYDACHDVFVRDRRAGTTARVSVTGTGKKANADSWAASSANGRLVVFTSLASNIVPGDTNICANDSAVHVSCPNVFVRAAQDSGSFQPMAPAPCNQRRRSCYHFASDASNLVAGDTNGRTDVSSATEWRRRQPCTKSRRTQVVAIAVGDDWTTGIAATASNGWSRSRVGARSATHG